MKPTFSFNLNLNVRLILHVQEEVWTLDVLKHGVYFDEVIKIDAPYSNAPQITEAVSFPEIQTTVPRLIDLAKLITSKYRLELKPV